MELLAPWEAVAMGTGGLVERAVELGAGGLAVIRGEGADALSDLERDAGGAEAAARWSPMATDGVVKPGPSRGRRGEAEGGLGEHARGRGVAGVAAVLDAVGASAAALDDDA
ncbi:MAG: hypothetical protein H6745_33680 [Deltaproteobacteria bacterium]|nr:hypothetical protein [Deltaproteobacteria bacterium]